MYPEKTEMNYHTSSRNMSSLLQTIFISDFRWQHFFYYSKLSFFAVQRNIYFYSNSPELIKMKKVSNVVKWHGKEDPTLNPNRKRGYFGQKSNIQTHKTSGIWQKAAETIAACLREANKVLTFLFLVCFSFFFSLLLCCSLLVCPWQKRRAQQQQQFIIHKTFRTKTRTPPNDFPWYSFGT